jgi:plasmid stabilization system protein ParE
MPRYRVLPEAEDDILAQAAYFDDRGTRETAERWVDMAYETFDQIAGGRRFGELRQSRRREYQSVRLAPVIDFPTQVVVYRQVPDGIIVLRVLGGRQDLNRILGPRR